MSHIPAPASSFYTDLLQFDLDTTRRLKRHGCQTCGGALDRADYGRKYRGAVAGEVSGFDQRFSRCCRRDGCRRRLTPQSVRFLGRKVYLAFLVVLASAEASEKEAFSSGQRERHLAPDAGAVAGILAAEGTGLSAVEEHQSGLHAAAGVSRFAWRAAARV